MSEMCEVFGTKWYGPRNNLRKRIFQKRQNSAFFFKMAFFSKKNFFWCCHAGREVAGIDRPQFNRSEISSRCPKIFLAQTNRFWHFYPEKFRGAKRALLTPPLDEIFVFVGFYGSRKVLHVHYICNHFKLTKYEIIYYVFFLGGGGASVSPGTDF